LGNTLTGMQELVKQADKLELQVTEDNRKRARYVVEISPTDSWTLDMAEKLQLLWRDPAIQDTWLKAPEFQIQVALMDYHMTRLSKYMDDNFVPTNDDMLRARQRTTGAVETSFVIEKFEWKIIDCGGQKPERTKWEAILKEYPVNAMIFFAALDEYNMASSEETGKTKMQIAMQSFREILSSENTKKTPLLLFLNKKDLFEKKINSKKDFEAFQTVFPQYEKGQSLVACSNFVELQFKNIAKSEGRKPDDLYVHLTCALDTDAMDAVFRAVSENLFQANMLESMM